VTVSSVRAASPPAWASFDGFDALGPLLPGGRQAPRPPKAAVELVEQARAAGWKTLLQWGEDSAGEPFLSVELALAEPYHHYRLSWHSRGQLARVDPADEFTRDVSGARLRLFSMLVTTLGAGARAVDVPSLKAIRQTIDAHPALHVTEPGGPPPSTTANEGGTR
jgi:hypothetical protein